MSEPHPLDNLAPAFWARPELINAWRLCFEDESHRIRLLTRVLRHLPEARGRVEFLDEFPGDRFVLLVVLDMSNNQSYQNMAWILSVLAESRAITTIATEAAVGLFDFDRFRLPDLQTSRKIAHALLTQSKLSPPSFVGATASEPVTVFGIDDAELYQIARQHVLEKNAKYINAILRRAPRMFENILTLIAERNLSALAVCATDYNFDEFRRMLRDRKITHAGIRPRIGGPSISLDKYWKTANYTSLDVEEYWMKMASLTGPVDDLFDPEPNGMFRRTVSSLRRFIGLKPPELPPHRRRSL